MYEEYYLPIPDPEKYLERLRLPRPAFPDLAALNALIYAHHIHIPFEDLDSSYFRKPVTLDIPSLYKKIITDRRGGYCYEMNALFTRLLLDLGYKARSVFCRIVRGRDFIPPCTHRGIIVELEDGLYFCDVGYGGPMPAGALLLQDGYEALLHGESFRVNRYDENWWALSRTTSAGEQENLLHFNTFPQTPVEFIAANLKACTDPESIFVQKILVNLRTETGSCSLTDHQLTIRDGETTKQLQIKDNRQLHEVLNQYFGIHI